MQRAALPIILAVILLLIAVFYLIPGVAHPLVFSGSPTSPHLKHAVLFAGLAVLSLIWARFAANAAQR